MLLLLHGALYTQREFEPLIPHLGGHDAVRTLDFSGHGQAPMPDEPFSIGLFAGEVLRLMDEAGIESADIFGFSMGGYVGLYLVRNFPDRVGRVMTLGTKLDWNPETSAGEVKMLNPGKISEKVPKFAEVLKARHGADRWEQVLGKTAEMMLNLGNAPELPYNEFPDIAHGIRLCVGDHDHMVSLEETVRAYRQAPNAELCVLPGTGHPLEKIPPAELAAQIRSFLA